MVAMVGERLLAARPVVESADVVSATWAPSPKRDVHGYDALTTADGAVPSRPDPEENEPTPLTGGAMTEIRDDAVISEALSVIDKALADMLNRELVSTDEVADLLLDVRSLLVTAPQPADH
jgi:hypothetical protein